MLPPLGALSCLWVLLVFDFRIDEFLQNADRVLDARTFGFMDQFILFPDTSAERPLVLCREDGVIAIIVENAVDFHACKLLSDLNRV